MRKSSTSILGGVYAVLLGVGVILISILLGVFLPKPDWFPVPLSKAQVIEIIKEYEASK